MNTFKDHFSSASDRYAAYRPDYPAALFAWLAGLCAEHDLAWDCATGSGQAAQEAGATGDVGPALRALSQMQGSCVACHAGYELK